MHSLNSSLVTIGCMKDVYTKLIMIVYRHLKNYLKEITLFQCTIETFSVYPLKLFKVFNGICPDIMKDVFPLSTSSIYDIRSRCIFTTRSVKTVYYGTEHLSCLAPKVWELIPNNIKSLENLPKFKKAIKNWKPVI